MSLTWHLHHCRDSAVGEFLQQRFMYTASLTRRANRQMEHTNIALPDTLGSQYKILEKALYYRIGYSFAHTNTQDLPAWRLAPHVILQITELSRVDFSEVFETFFQRLESTLSMLQPARRSLDTPSEEILARYCFVLGSIEETFRSSTYTSGPFIAPSPKQSVEELLSLPQQAWIHAFIRVFDLFYDRHATLLLAPSVFDPSFSGHDDLGKENADIIVDGCLFEIKVSCEPKISAFWIRRLAATVLLDYEDKYHIHSVAIYMAQQGKLLQWPLEEFFYKLTGGSCSNVSLLRREFRICCEAESLSLL